MDDPVINDRIYISGPMTGLTREQYIRRFMLAEKVLRDNGYRNIVNPIHVWTCRFRWLYKILGYRLTLFYDLWLLTRCQRIYKMPGWKESRGANIESCVAYHFNVWVVAKPVRDILDKELEDIPKTS